MDKKLKKYLQERNKEQSKKVNPKPMEVKIVYRQEDGARDKKSKIF
jgi:hypothetical protein